MEVYSGTSSQISLDILILGGSGLWKNHDIDTLSIDLSNIFPG